MTTAGRHHAPEPMPGRVAVTALCAVAGFDAAAGTMLALGYGNQLTAMAVIAGSVLAATTTVCLYYAEKVDPDD
jgi:hypothetical protein